MRFRDFNPKVENKQVFFMDATTIDVCHVSKRAVIESVNDQL